MPDKRACQIHIGKETYKHVCILCPSMCLNFNVNAMSIQYAMKTTEEPTPSRSESLLQIEYVLKYLYQNALELTGIVHTLYNSKEDRFIEETQCPSRYG